MPDSRPNLVIDEGGICSACTNFKKPFVSRRWFEKIAAEAKENRDWDCVIPVSGGKDNAAGYKGIRV